MKKLVFLMAICLVPNLVIAVGEWPIFSNKAEDPLSFESLMIIAANTENTHIIENFSYKITEFNSMDAVNAANKDKSVVAEFRPVEVIAEAGTTYNLYIDNRVVDGTDTIIERQVASEEEVPLGNSSSVHQGNHNDDEMVLQSGKKNGSGKKGWGSSCNLL